MYSLLSPFLFHLDEEKAHAFTLSALHYLPKYCFKQPKKNPLRVLGLEFKHPIGLAAGLDKNAEHLDALDKLGFAFIEVGTTTPKPQTGNPKPRLFRLPAAQAIINRMGFNNQGVHALIANIKKSHYTGILGINIGKNKDTPLNRAAEDYVYCMRQVYEQASYITINISSPNTPELRDLQQAEYLDHLLKTLCQVQEELREHYKKQVPLVLKISPDEGEESLKRMAEIILRHRIEGVIATNTTSSRNLPKEIPHASEIGGLSGKPLASLSTECLKLLKSLLKDEVVFIGSGGIDSYSTAQEKFKAGASLLQVYTGLIYKGPQLISELSTCPRVC